MEIAAAGPLLAGLLAVPVYAYVGYPAMLKVVGSLRPRRASPPPLGEWPTISITVPAYNEEAQIRGLIESLLRLDYPADRRQIVIVSDASTDRTDEIVREYEAQGVELLRAPVRAGKGAAEMLAKQHLRGEIVLNTDASIRIRPDALKPLIARFADPEVGLASGRDLSVGSEVDEANIGESGYVGYEMWIRKLETDIGGIVGASGCFYAIRRHLHEVPLPPELSRDFAAALITHEMGYRAVSVDEAVCYVPRAPSLHREYHRKVRTMARGLQTLGFKRHLLHPVRHGRFAWMLFSHKLCRWIVPWSLLFAAIFITSFALAGDWWARGLLAAGAALAIVAAIGWRLAAVRPLPRPLSIPTFAVAANVAALHAWILALSGDRNPIWEPTRREVVEA